MFEGTMRPHNPKVLHNNLQKGTNNTAHTSEEHMGSQGAKGGTNGTQNSDSTNPNPTVPRRITQ